MSGVGGGDHTGTILGLLAAAFSVHPQLWLAGDQPFAMEAKPLVEHFITRAAQSDAMKTSPEVRGLMGGSAGGPELAGGGEG